MIGEPLLEIRVGQLLLQHKLILATAESCTGGLVAHRLTNISGSSAYFWGGVVSYDNSVKQHLLGVPEAILNSLGAVSRECAKAMAMGAVALLKTSLAVSITGIAGPGGSTPGKPVGLVYIALADNKGFLRCERYLWDSDREGNKALSATAALQMVEDYLLELPAPALN